MNTLKYFKRKHEKQQHEYEFAELNINNINDLI